MFFVDTRRRQSPHVPWRKASPIDQAALCRRLSGSRRRDTGARPPSRGTTAASPERSRRRSACPRKAGERLPAGAVETRQRTPATATTRTNVLGQGGEDLQFHPQFLRSPPAPDKELHTGNAGGRPRDNNACPSAPTHYQTSIQGPPQLRHPTGHGGAHRSCGKGYARLLLTACFRMPIARQRPVGNGRREPYKQEHVIRKLRANEHKGRHVGACAAHHSPRNNTARLGSVAW